MVGPILAFLCGAVPALAEKVIQGPAIFEGKTEAGGVYIDDLLKQLKTKPAAGPAKQMSQIWAGIKKKRFQEVLQTATSLAQNPFYNDYARWFEAEARVGLALKLPPRQRGEGLRRALRALGEIETIRPDSPLAKKTAEQMAQIEFLMGDAAHQSKNWVECQKGVEAALTRLVQSSQFFVQRIPFSALVNYAQACQKKPSDTCPLWARRLTAAFPKESKEAKVLLATFPSVAKGGEPEAYVDFSKSYKAPDQDQVAIEDAFASYYRGDFGTAAEKFEKVSAAFPQSSQRHRVRFWAARSWEKDKSPDRARLGYEDTVKSAPLTYYGLMASRALGVPIEARIDAVLPLASPQDENLDPLDRMRLKRAEELFSRNLPELAAIELDSINVKREMSGAFVMYLAALNHELHNYGASFRQVSDLIQRGTKGIVSTFGLRLIFPLLHFEQIQRTSEALTIDPILVLSLMKQESAFRASALSRSGATGLMQLMPFTAVAVEPEIEQAELLVAENSIRIGSKYLAEMINKFDGNWVYALGAYNAGPTRMARWRKDAQPQWDMLEFIESISYTETREYVAAIVRNYYWYTYRLHQKRPEDFSMFWKVVKPQNGSG